MHLKAFGDHPRETPPDMKYIPAPSTLMRITTTIHTEIQMAELVSLFQYPMRIAAALRGDRGKKTREDDQLGIEKPQFGWQGDDQIVPIIPTEKEAEPFGNVALRHGNMATGDGEVRHHFAKRDL